MKYIRVKWKHSNDDDPVVIVSEIDDERWERRKLEVFSSGEITFADEHESTGTSQLGLEAWPDLSVLAAEPEFEVEEISKAEFEDLWSRRTRG